MINILKNNTNALEMLEYTKLFNKKNKKIENSLNIILQFFDNNKINEENIEILLNIAINNNEENVYSLFRKFLNYYHWKK